MGDEKLLTEIFAKNIRKIRKNNHLTQKELAEKLGVGISTVSDWEKAKKMPRAGVIEKISNEFKITKSSLFEDLEKNEIENTLVQPQVLSDREQELLDLFRSLSDKDQYELLMIAKLKKNQSQERSTTNEK